MPHSHPRSSSDLADHREDLNRAQQRAKGGTELSQSRPKLLSQGMRQFGRGLVLLLGYTLQTAAVFWAWTPLPIRQAQQRLRPAPFQCQDRSQRDGAGWVW